MAEERLEQAQEATEKEYAFGYTVKVAKDGSIDVSGLEIDGQTITADAIYDHIAELNKVVEENKMAQVVKNAAMEAAYYAVRRAYQDIEAMKAAQAAAEATPKVEE